MESEKLIKKLPILSENVLSDAAEQPLIFVQAARYRVQKMRERSQKVALRDYMVSKLGLLLRARKNRMGDRITENAIKEKIAVHPKVRRASDAVELAYAREEFSKLLLEAFRMRRDAIRVIADAQNYEGISEMREVERVEARRKLVKKARELHQQRMAVREE